MKNACLDVCEQEIPAPKDSLLSDPVPKSWTKKVMQSFRIMQSFRVRNDVVLDSGTTNSVLSKDQGWLQEETKVGQ